MVNVPSPPPGLSADLLKVMLLVQGLGALSPSRPAAVLGQPGRPRGPSQGTRDMLPPDHKPPANVKGNWEGSYGNNHTCVYIRSFSLIEFNIIY